MTQAYIYDGARTAFGRHGGVLSSIRPDDLLAHVIQNLASRNVFSLEDYEDVIAGNTNQAGEDSRNIARNAALLAGMAIETGGITVNRLCGSGLSAILDATRCIKVGEGELFVAAGVESMSRAPLIISKAQRAFDRHQTLADSTMGARFSNPGLIDQFGGDSMPKTAENIAYKLKISRAASDTFALASQTKYESARQAGFYSDEIIPISVAQRKSPALSVDIDEHPRAASTIAGLQTLKPLIEGGTVTAGNASGINDGAAALIIGSEAMGIKHGAKARGKILSGAIAGVEPRLMGLGPVAASRKALERAGLALQDMDVIELNEAFAVQALGCLQLMGISFDDSRVNPNGGAIAIGHPLGASGTRILLTALRQLERSGGRYALVTMCIGIGQGIAAVIERL